MSEKKRSRAKSTRVNRLSQFGCMEDLTMDKGMVQVEEENKSEESWESIFTKADNKFGYNAT